MKFILAKKLEMGQKFTEDGSVIPVTLVVAKPCVITQVKDEKKDGYRALQIGCGEKKKLNKALSGHLKDLVKLADLREFKLDKEDQTEYKKGQEISINIFEKGEKIKVSGDSKGKGFQGVIKRHGFHGADATHGTKDQERAPGSIGATGPAHVFKGTKMAGRMGGTQVTVSNLEIVDLDPEKNIIYIKGAVPGARNSLIEITAQGQMDLDKKEEVKEQKEKEVKKGGEKEAKEETVGKEDKAEDKKEVKEDKKEEKKESSAAKASDDKDSKPEEKKEAKTEEKSKDETTKDKKNEDK